jgi:hypothetical protein
MIRPSTAFFAYGSETPSCGEFIEAAIKEINNSGHSINVKSWKNLSIGGNFLISSILSEIALCDLFCCDITNLNENVLFELGFAIAIKKPIWIIQDVTISESFQRYKEFILLNNIGYINYTSSKHIVEAFLNQKQYLAKKPLFDSLPIDSDGNEDRKILFYLKSQIDQNYNQYIVGQIELNKIPVLIDDSNENKTFPISWYLKNLIRIPAILVEFSGVDRSNHQIHNAKCSLIAGLALGLNKKYKFIASQPYPSAIDYQEHLARFNNLLGCQNIVDPFLKDIRSHAIELISEKVDFTKYKRKDGILQKIKFGEMLAEHESNDIYEYYVNTANDDNLLKAEYNIIVGRKGSGKTAAFYYLNTKFCKDVRNQVVIIKPINFEIDGLIELIQSTNIEFGKSYIVESVWKFLIYTEILKSIYLKVSEKPKYALKKNEEAVITFVASNKEKFLPDLSSRLNQLFNDLKFIGGTKDHTEFQMKFSEVLHQDLFKSMIGFIIDFMINKGALVLLIDNLDKNWRKGSNMEITSKFILGLLSVIGRVNKDLKGGSRNPVDIRMNLVVFLRSDIFKQIIKNAREPDKIEYTRLIWTDSEVLFRLIDKRIDYLSVDSNIDGRKFWDQYITQNVDGQAVKDFINNCIIPRPRDLIFFINCSKSNAVAKGHSYIEANDLKSAYQEYSNWAFQSLMVENGITINQLKEFFYHIVGEKSIISYDKIVQVMAKTSIPNDSPDQVEYFIEHLCSLSFIGREIRKNEFYFDYGYEIDDKKLFQSKRLNSNRFKIHNAFIPYMECEDYVI